MIPSRIGITFKAGRWGEERSRRRLWLAGPGRETVGRGRPAVPPAGSPWFETLPAAAGCSTSS